MKHRPCLILLLLAALTPAPSFAQARTSGQEPRMDEARRKTDAGSREPGEAFREMDLRSRELALEDQKSKLSFDTQMRKIQIAERGMALEQASRLPTGRPPMCPPFACGPGGPRCPVVCPWGFLAVCAVVHLLLAWWVADDIKRRKVGSRIWVVMALVTGLIGTFVYAVVRIGDRPAP